MTGPQLVANELDEAQAKPTSRASVLALLIFVPFVVQAMVYLKTLLQYMFVRNDALNPEGASIYAFLTAFRTGRLYSSPLDFPWNEQMYGPVYYTVGSILAKAAHGDPMLTTILARMVSFLSFLGAAALVGYLGWRLEGQKRWTAVCVVLALGCGWTLPFCASARPDALSILFILGAVAAYVAAHESAEGRGRLIFFAGILGALSILTKQSTAPVLFALMLDGVIARKFRNTAGLIAGSASTTALIVSILWLRHEPFLANLTAVGHALFNWRSVPLTALNMMRINQTAAIPIGIACLGAALSWKKERYRAILLVAGLAWISNVAALANTGATANYMILPWLLTIALVPAGLKRVEEYSRHASWAPAGLIVLGMVLLIHQRSLLLRKPEGDLDTRGVDRLELLTTNSTYLELRSREPQYLDAFYYHQLALQKLWSNAPILRRIDEEEYDMVLIGGEDGPADSVFWVAGYRGTSTLGADTLGELDGHYRVLCEVTGTLALVPRDRPNPLQDSDVARIYRQPCRATGRIPQMQAAMR